VRRSRRAFREDTFFYRSISGKEERDLSDSVQLKRETIKLDATHFSFEFPDPFPFPSSLIPVSDAPCSLLFLFLHEMRKKNPPAKARTANPATPPPAIALKKRRDGKVMKVSSPFLLCTSRWSNETWTSPVLDFFATTSEFVDEGDEEARAGVAVEDESRARDS